MGDLLTAYAATQPDKTAVIDDRTGGDVRTLTYAELEARANQLVWALVDLGVRPGDKIVWCGQNSTGIVEVMNAARKIGATAVPLNYRLSDEEAAYVVDHCDATTVYVDAEYASTFERIRSEIPKVTNVVVFDGEAPDGMLAIDPLVAAASTEVWERPEIDEGGATMIYTSGTTGKPKGAFRRNPADPRQGAALLAHIGYRPDDIYLTTGPLYHSGPGGFMSTRDRAGQHRGAAAKVRSAGLAAAARDVPGDVDLLGADADPDDLQPAGGGASAVRPVVDAGDDRQRRTVELRARSSSTWPTSRPSHCSRSTARPNSA